MLLDTPHDLLVGQVLDQRYRLTRRLGQGGMGVVYEAEHLGLGRQCAIKLLLPQHSNQQVLHERFRREAQIAARVHHPHVVEVYDTGATAEGGSYIAMELLVGEGLDQLLAREHRLTWPRARQIILQICEALVAAHAQRIVHRDLKPANCFVVRMPDQTEFIKLLDFGIAKLQQTDPAVRLTDTNGLIGTYSYMSTEQISGNDCDHRADIWAVGVILYEMLTGRLPFPGNHPAQIWSSIMTSECPHLRATIPPEAYPPELDSVLQTAMAKQRELRFSNIQDLAAALARLEPSLEWAVSVAPLPEATTSSPPQARPQLDPFAETALPSYPTVAARSVHEAATSEPTAVSSPRARKPWIAVLIASLVVGLSTMVLITDPLKVLSPPEPTRVIPARDSPQEALNPTVAAPVVAPPKAEEPSSPPERLPTQEPAAPSLEPKASTEPKAPTTPKASTSSSKPRPTFEAQVRGSLPRINGSKPIQACFSRHGPGETVAFTLVADASKNRFIAATPASLYSDTPLGNCLVDAVKAAKLPSGGTGTVEIKFKFVAAGD